MGRAQLRRELTGVALLLFAIFLAVAVVGGHASLSGSCTRASSPMGPAGACVRAGLVALVGAPAAFLIPLIPAVHALRLFGRMRSDTDRSWLFFLIGVVLLLPVAIALTIDAGRETTHAAGVWGGFVAYYLEAGLHWGAWLAVALAFSALTILTLAWNPIRVVVGTVPPHTATDEASDAADVVAHETTEPRGRWKRRKTVVAGAEATTLEPTPEEMPAINPSLMLGEATEPAAEQRDALPIPRRGKKGKSTATLENDERIAAAIEATEELSERHQELPPIELLTPSPPRNADAGRRELDEMGAKLKDALGTFRVEAEITGRTTGPVVTQFEVEPAPGVKVRQIANLADDLALAMRAASIRIVAPIPGRGAVGVEVPNPSAEIVAFRELVESREYQGARAALPIALGKDLEGKPIVADLAKMPHLLIAGATGSGKSVCVNTIITSLAYRHTPRTLRFLMVDPKMVELSVYNVLPHLRHKVITDNRDAAAVLKWAVIEMQERYELLAANGCRNVQDFNRRVQAGDKLKRPKRPDVAFEELAYTGDVIPYIVVVIDELADLMMTVQGEVETPLAMLAQKARAIGLHLILATQRPSVNVITGLIKANFPSRIAFRVASQVDSRTIIDGVGAETLLGNGDMLFIPPGKSEPARLQGAYISSEDTERLMHWYEGRAEERRAKAEAEGLIAEEPLEAESDILEEIRQREAMEAGGAQDSTEPGERDKLFREAAEVVIQHQLGSTSLLQRRLKIGYGRAARIIDQLHDAGVLGPPDGSKARDVLAGLEDLDRICGT
ncbi:MAG TPA: DNA translocase FtsK 4TM domain-containing protein [Gemmatimonadaceae bacterium]|nr:DNA translocase FtsK 4TM domain-containing protein [Gemmatimonadaceae bacterium]